MPDDNPYNRALQEARQAARVEYNGSLMVRPARGLLQRLNRLYARMLVDLQADLDAGAITAERAEGLRRSIEAAMLRLEREYSQSARTAIGEAMQLAAGSHEAGTRATLEGASVTLDVGDSFTQVPGRVLQEGLRRRPTGGAQTFQALIRRNLQASANVIDDVIQSAVGRGVSNQRLAQQVAVQLAQNDEQVLQVVSELGSVGRATANAAAQGIEDEALAKRVRGVLNEARRIGVHEINSHYDEADKISASVSPVVDLVEWNVSSRHDSLKSSPDVCDVLEKQDLYGYGAGLYHPETVPSLPHPYCMCFTTVVLRDPADYGGEGRPVPDKPTVSRGDVKGIMSSTGGERTVTEKHVDRQAETLRTMTGLAHEHAR